MCAAALACCLQTEHHGEQAAAAADKERLAAELEHTKQRLAEAQEAVSKASGGWQGGHRPSHHECLSHTLCLMDGWPGLPLCNAQHLIWRLLGLPRACRAGCGGG